MGLKESVISLVFTYFPPGTLKTTKGSDKSFSPSSAFTKSLACTKKILRFPL